MARSEYQLRNRVCRGAEFYDVGYGDRASPEYRRGVKVLKRWHQECAARRRGISSQAITNAYRRLPKLTIGGVTKTISEWCDVYQIDYQMVYNRHRRHDMSWFDALTTPVSQRKKGGAHVK